MAGESLKIASAIVAACFALTTGHAAAQDKTYLEEYKAYNNALDAGDSAAAAEHGYNAWQAAERELGDNSLTAILAYNYGQYVLTSDTKSALVALNRASELQAAGIADLPEGELEIYRTYAELALDPQKSRKREDFRAALQAAESEDYSSSAEMAMMWLRLALADIGDRDYKNAMASAANAESKFLNADPAAYRKRAESLLALGIATMFHNRSHPDDLISANQHFINAGRLFPVQKDLKTFDPTLAMILAWNNTAFAWLRSEAAYQAHPETYLGSRIRLAVPESEKADPTKFSEFDYEAVFSFSKSLEACNVEWASREPPDYPTKGIQSGYVGTALVGYDISSNLAIENPVILAEVPGNIFGQAAVESMADWTFAKAPDNIPECMNNRLTVFTFTLGPE